MIAVSSTADTERLLVLLTVVLLVGPFLIQKVRLPGIVGLVLGGAVIGPEGLGFLRSGELDGLGEIGLLYLMFMAGLELDMFQLRRYRTAALRFGVITFTAPFVLGWGGALLAGEPGLSALLLGSIWASHTLVSLPEVKRAGLSSNRSVAITVSATVLTDTLSLTVLAIATSAAADRPDGVAVTMLVVGFSVLGAYCLWLVPRVGAWVFRVVARDRRVRFVFLLGVFSSAALIASAFGIEGLVGAFLAGIGANRLVPAGGALMERTEFVGSAFFIPVFLVYVGTQLDLAVLGSPTTLVTAAGFLGVVVVGKTAAALISARLEGLTRQEAGLMTGLTVGQAAATLAATLVGKSVGLFDEQIVNAVLVTVLVVILISSIVTSQFARRITPELVTDRPLGSSVLVLIPPDGPDEGIVTFATRIARAHGGRLLLLRVVDQDASTDERRAARADVADATRTATQLGADAEAMLRIDASMADGMLNAAAEQEASLLVAGWKPSTTRTERIFGHTVEEIGARSHIPMIAGNISSDAPEHALLALDDTPDGGGTRVDAEVGTALVSALASTGLACRIVSTDAQATAQLSLGAGLTVEQLSKDELEAAIADLPAEDLLILPADQLRRSRWSARVRLHRELVVVAGPYRLRATGADAAAGLAAMIGLDRARPT